MSPPVLLTLSLQFITFIPTGCGGGEVSFLFLFSVGGNVSRTRFDSLPYDSVEEAGTWMCLLLPFYPDNKYTFFSPCLFVDVLLL